MATIKLTAYAIYYTHSKLWDYHVETCDSMHTHGWIPTGQTFELKLDELPHHVLVQKTVEALKQEKSKIEAAAYVKAMEVQGQINDLLCIEDRSQEAEDDLPV